MSRKPKKSLLKFWEKVVLALCFIIFLGVAFNLSFKYFEAASEKYIVSEPPPSFHLFVSAGENFKVIEFSWLEDFKKDNLNYSFLVPENDLEKINRSFRLKSLDEKIESYPTISIEKETGGVQTIKINYNGDGIYSFRYEATEKNFKPLSTNVQGPGFVFGPCCLTAFLGIIVYGLLKFMLWYLRGRQVKKGIIGE